LPPVKAGLVRPLGVSAAERVADLPDLPTIAEGGYPDYRVSVWYGVAASARVPEEVAQAISASMNRALNDEAFRAALSRIGFWPLRARGEAAIKEFIDADKARWSNVIGKLNISLD